MIFEIIVVEQGNDKAYNNRETLSETTDISKPVEKGVGISIDHMHCHIKFIGNNHMHIV